MTFEPLGLTSIVRLVGAPEDGSSVSTSAGQFSTREVEGNVQDFVFVTTKYGQFGSLASVPDLARLKSECMTTAVN